MFKRVKSLLIAGLLVVGVGFTTVDSYAAEVNIDNAKIEFVYPHMPDSEKPYSYNENGIKVMVFNEEGIPMAAYGGEAPKGAYSISMEWDTSKVQVNSAKVIYNDETELYLEISGNNASLRSQTDIGIKSISIDYDLVDNSGEGTQEQQPVGDGKIDNPPLFDFSSISEKYIENMDALGSVSVDGTLRTIEKDAAISKKSWEKFVEDFNNNKDNGLTITWDENDISDEHGFYSVYITYGDQEKFVENISIDFYDVSNKGWLPEITPGTGQALAVGGIVIGAAALTGLVVNNKRKKDEE